MKVKILTPIVGAIAGVTFSYKPGDTPDVSKETAQDWIKAHHAEALEKPEETAVGTKEPVKETKKSAKSGE